MLFDLLTNKDLKLLRARQLRWGPL